MVAQNVFFYLFAALILGAAIAVVSSRNVVRAAIYLAVVFAGVAGIYILLAAEFLAATQVLVYLGAIMVLIIFGIMLTRAPIGAQADLTQKHWWVGAGTAVVLFGVMAYALIDSYEDEPLATSRDGVVSGITGEPVDDDLRIDDVVSTGFGSDLPQDEGADESRGSNVATISDEIFGVHLVPFEAVSVLLLASLVGAVVIARKDR
jgi:NADH-quinone oxidoreductase subunit J